MYLQILEIAALCTFLSFSFLLSFIVKEMNHKMNEQIIINNNERMNE